MVQLFIRGAGPRTTCVDVDAECSVSGLKECIQDCIGIPVDYQGFVYGGRQLEESTSLHCYGISAGSTVQLVYRMLGGKGGFGAQLRSMGRDGKVTDNFDACRDLSGKRVRHQVAEQKLAKWKEDAPQRELEAIAMKHIKEEARKARRAQAEEVDVEAIRSAQEEAINRTQQAVLDALGTAINNSAHSSKTTTVSAPGTAGASTGLPDGSPGAKRKAGTEATASAAAPHAAKKSKMLACLEDVGSEDSSDEE